MINQATIQQIMDAARIEEVIGDFVTLHKRGANHIGCCPFHNEKTPSFYVSPSKGIYKCFGCGEAGNVVGFLEKHEHYSYPEALRYLAKKYNIEIEEEEVTPEKLAAQQQRDALYNVSEYAQRLFNEQLTSDEMGRAIGLSYFHDRGVSDQMIKDFGLGYALEERDAFTKQALAAGYSEDILIKSGLSIKNEDKGTLYDRFRGRVVFPIYSISGRVIGFSARILTSDAKVAKYVNSPESDIYSKSHSLYGIFQARSAIAKADKCYLVEGNIDVVSMHQSGLQNTVASCGTSLTIEQIRLIKRYTQNITILYDGDKAGIKASLRATSLLLEEGSHVRLVLFPEPEDPDSYARKYGSTALQEYINTHEENLVMYRTKVLLKEAESDPIRRASIISDTANTIALVMDPLERAEYVRQAARLLDIDETVLSSHVMRQRRQKRIAKEDNPDTTPATEQETQTPHSTHPPAPAPIEAPVSESERHLISLLLNYGNNPIPQSVDDGTGNFTTTNYTVAQIIIAELQADNLTLNDPLCQRIFEQCVLMLQYTNLIDPEQFKNSPDNELSTFAISLMLSPYNVSDSWQAKGVYVPTIERDLRTDLVQTIFNFKKQHIEHLLHQKRNLLRTADPQQTATLLTEIMDLENLQRQFCSGLNQIITTHLRS